jgi:hypothetical protein
MWEAVTGVEGISCEGYHGTLANRALFFPSQGGRYAKGCMALSWIHVK